MKTRLGALAIIAVLAGCSAQDDTKKFGNGEAESRSSTAASALAAYSHDSKRSLGDAPDKGELFTYKKSAVKHDGAYSLLPVQLSEEHAIRAAVTGFMTIPTPDGSEIKIRYERHEENADGNWSWIGRVVDGDAAQEAIITFGEKAVFGSIPQAKGPALRLTTQNGIAYLMQADPSKLFKAYGTGPDVKVATASAKDSSVSSDDPAVSLAMAKAREMASADVSTKAFTSANTVDLVAGYSNGLSARIGSDSGTVTLLTNRVTAANQALLNSKVNARIRLVYALKVTYADNTDNGDVLEQLTGNDGENPVTIPAALAPLRAARETYGADLVTLVRDFQSANNGCGIAWLLGANGTNITSAADAPFAYSVVSDGDYSSGGNTYFCEDITLAHEMAHNMGEAHDVANAGGISGRYPYSYGYKTTAAAGNFFTVMAYGDNNQTLYRVFSNPTITICGGLACGVANAADNARSLGQTIPTIATFRNTVVALPGARNDTNADGKSDLIFRSTSLGQISWWEMNGNTVGTKRTQAAGGTYTLSAVGDFNGDGRADIAWVNSSGAVVLYLGTGTAFSSVSSTSMPAGWSLVAAGDINGDGKSDLILRNAASGQVSWRLMNGATVTATHTQAAGSAYTLSATGDFNADGRTDLAWANAAGSVVMYLANSTGTGFTSVSTNSLASGWSLAGAGDINGDGKSDLILRNTSAGQVNWRLMNGAAVLASYTQVAGNAYTLSAIGDFNGDSRSDLAWTNSAGRIVTYTANATGTSFTSATLASTFSSSWSLKIWGK